MLIAISPEDESCFREETLDELYKVIRDNNFDVDDMVFYELGPRVEVEVKMIRRQTLKRKE